MKRIYEVKFIKLYEGEGLDWEQAKMSVLANGDAQKAIDKVRKKVLSEKMHVEGVKYKCVGFKLEGVSILAEADI